MTGPNIESSCALFDLSGRLFTSTIQNIQLRAGFGYLQSKRTFTDAWFTPDEYKRANHKAATKHTVQFRNITFEPRLLFNINFCKCSGRLIFIQPFYFAFMR